MQIDDDLERDFSLTKVRADALKLLTAKNYSTHKLTDKLLQKGHELVAIEEVLEELRQEKLFQENFYIEGRIKAFARKNCSPEWIRLKLRQEKVFVELDVIEAVFNDLGLTRSMQKENLINRKTRYREASPASLSLHLRSKGHYDF